MFVFFVENFPFDAWPFQEKKNKSKINQNFKNVSWNTENRKSYKI